MFYIDGFNLNNNKKNFIYMSYGDYVVCSLFWINEGNKMYM